MKWEYEVLPVEQLQRETRKSYQQLLNIAGTEGWELVSVDNGTAYFKRPLRTKSEAEIMKHFENRQSLV